MVEEELLLHTPLPIKVPAAVRRLTWSMGGMRNWSMVEKELLLHTPLPIKASTVLLLRRWLRRLFLHPPHHPTQQRQSHGCTSTSQRQEALQ
jgi:hypothetical protein